MRIAISCITDIAKSGPWQVIRNLIDQLKQLDRNNEYVLYVEKTYCEDFGDLPANFRIRRAAISATQPVLNLLWHSVILPLRLIADRVDIVHIPWASAPLLVKVRPTILTIHDLIEYRIRTHYSRSRMVYRKAVLPWSTKAASAIIAPSEYTKREITRILNTPENKVHVVYNGVNSRFRKMDTPECKTLVKKRTGISGPFILYVGQIYHPNKNLVRLLHAYKRIKSGVGIPHKMIMIGRPHASAHVVTGTAKDLGLLGDVVFTGYLPDEDLPYFYNGADIFVYPSLFEGFGIPPLEAMACGCPVISSNTSSLTEVVGEAGILVDPESVEDITGAMIEVLSNAERRKTMIQNGFQQVQKFSWQRSARALLTIYEGLK
jgi:glycosyltransferase involved in cell wall biosynthesis